MLKIKINTRGLKKCQLQVRARWSDPNPCECKVQSLWAEQGDHDDDGDDGDCDGDDSDDDYADCDDEADHEGRRGLKGRGKDFDICDESSKRAHYSSSL